jgi:hypothetical protein
MPLPSLLIQEEFANEIENQRLHVDSAMKLIEIFEGRTQVVIAKLWSV